MKYVLSVVALLVGLKFGIGYITSEDFQVYADANKVTWSCPLNNLLGNFYMTMSRYDLALKLFQRVVKRCPKTSSAEEAEFQSAVALEKMGSRYAAIEAYRTYAVNYKNTKRAETAVKAADLLGA